MRESISTMLTIPPVCRLHSLGSHHFAHLRDSNLSVEFIVFFFSFNRNTGERVRLSKSNFGLFTAVLFRHTITYSERETQLCQVKKKKTERFSPHLENNCTFKIYLTEKENRTITITIKKAAAAAVAVTTTLLVAIVWLKWTVTRLMCVLCALY